MVEQDFALMTDIGECEKSSYITLFAVDKILAVVPPKPVTRVDSLATGFNLDAYWWLQIAAVSVTNI